MDEGSDGGELERVRAAALRRWRLNIMIVSALFGAGGVVFALTLNRGSHQSGIGARLALAAFIIVAVGALAAVTIRATRPPGSVDSVPLAAGLPRAERRQVARAVRHGRPSDDRVRRHVEINSAKRIVRANRQGRWTLPLMTVVFTVNLVSHHELTVWTVVLSAAMVAGVVATVTQERQVRGARRYLAVVGVEVEPRPTRQPNVLDRAIERRWQWRSTIPWRDRLVPFAVWVVALTAVSIADTITTSSHDSGSRALETATAMLFTIGLLLVAVAFLYGIQRAPIVSAIVAALGVVATSVTAIARQADRASNLIALPVFALVVAYSVRLAHTWQIRFATAPGHVTP